MSKDYYKILGVEKSASGEEIKKAYRKLALEYHPDRGGGEAAEKKFKEINEAYQVLSNPEKRSQYDQFGSASFNGGSGQNQGFGGFDFSGFQSDGFGFGFGGGIGDIFEEFFGQTFSHINAEIEITPAQAVVGDKIAIDVSGEKLEFEIPAGTQDGTTFRFPNRGKSYKNGKRGDLNLTIKVKIPGRISREQRELWKKLLDLEHDKKSWWKR